LRADRDRAGGQTSYKRENAERGSLVSCGHRVLLSGLQKQEVTPIPVWLQTD
jgi:hypothetical protein